MTDKELRELDAWIATHLFSWENCRLAPKSTLALGVAPGDEARHIGEDFQSEKYSQIPYFSTYPAAAMEVLKKCATRGVVSGEHNIVVYQPCDVSRWGVGIDPAYSSDKLDFAYAKTLELAICLFAKQMFK